MADPKEIAQIVERVVGEQLDAHVSQLRQDIVARVLEAVKPALEGKEKEREPVFTSAPPSAELDGAVSAIQDVTSQSDILRNLLEGCAKFCSRAALFVIRSGAGNGWQARGFADDNVVKNVQVDVNKGLAARAFQTQNPAAAAAIEFDAAFNRAVGNPADGNALILPLVVKEKVAALVYCDCGTEKAWQIDNSALQLLVRSAGMWLELLGLRKTAGTEKAEAEAPAAMATAPPPSVVAAPPPAPEPEPEAAPPPPPPPPAQAARAAPAAEPAIAPGDEEVHKKAKRFAKLLVDEIKLYNKDKVAKGREHRDLYERLKEDIEKSRATYDKRYGSTPAGAGDYFSKEVVRILADNDRSLMGSNFPS
ncbi:MAG TPA: hypothetical protein VMS96_02095 [Terriglobales bacterium]|nr:hypothetical protein [Terriglobales bacterium]